MRGPLLLLVIMLVLHGISTIGIAAAEEQGGSTSDGTSSNQLNGQRTEVEGTEVVWQSPYGQKPKGLLLAFHGCSHGAIDWWPKSSGCLECLGLPEEVLITRTALSRGYAVVAVSSRDRNHRRCWAMPHQPGSHTVDTLSVVAVVKELQKQNDVLEGVPLYALGASSGGAFALTLTAFLPLSGVCSQIMALPSTWQRAFLDAHDDPELGPGKAWPQPPVLFVHMTRDKHTASRVKESVELRHSKNLVTQVISVEPQPLTPELLARAPELAGDVGLQLIKLLNAKGVINASGLLTDDPRRSNWRGIIRESGVAGLKDLNLKPDESGLSELLNVAYAQHEIIADTATKMLDWFEQQPVVTAAVAGAP